MAPEQVRRAAHHIDGRTDIYGLGVILYEMLCGRRPFEAKTRDELEDQILNREAKPPRQIKDSIPPQLERICLKAVSKRINDRYTTANDLADELREHAKEVGYSRHAKAIPQAGDTMLPGLTFARITDDPQALVHQQVGGYVLKQFVGAGGTGLAYRASNTRTGQEACVKVFYAFPPSAQPDLVARAIARWVRGLSALNHPNVAKPLDYGPFHLNDGSSFYVATEFIEGSPLSRWNLTLDEVRGASTRMRIALDITRALQAAHNCIYIDDVGFECHGVLHGDVKPSNVIVRPDDSAVVVDFMMVDVQRLVVRHQDGTGGQNPNDDPRTDSFGTPGFMAPEQSTDQIVTAKTDIFALGKTLAFLFFPNQRLEAVASPSESDGYGAGLIALLRTMVETDPNLRPSDMATVGRRLTAPSLGQNVQFSVYRPKTIQPQQWQTMLAFAHLSDRPASAAEHEPDPVQEVGRQARHFLGANASEYKAITREGERPVPSEGELTFVPDVPGIEFNPRSRTFIWEETVHREVFRLRASAELDGQRAEGRLTVFLGAIILAEVPLIFCVDSSYTPDAQTEEHEPATARPYRKIFASYSRKDSWIVGGLKTYAQALGDEYIRKHARLRAGEEWSDHIESLIEEADVFQLFWSSNSMHSPIVRREWECALSLRRPSFIRPCYWESPLPACPEKDLPPEELRRLHFQRIPVSFPKAVTRDKSVESCADAIEASPDLEKRVEVKREKISEAKWEQPKPKVEPRRASPWQRRLAAAGVLASSACIVSLAFLLFRPDPNDSNSSDAAKKGTKVQGKPLQDAGPRKDVVKTAPEKDLIAMQIMALLRKSEVAPLRAALDGLKVADNLASDHAQAEDFKRQIKTARENRVKQHREELWKLATEAVEKNRLDARQRLIDIPGTDNWLAKDFSILPVQTDPRAQPLWTKYIKNIIPIWPKADGWRERLEDCRKADPEDLWVQACARECLLEDESLRKVYGKDYTKDLSDQVAYARYVRGMAKSNANDAAACLELLAGNTDAWFAVTQRRTRAANVLEAAAKEQRKADAFYETEAQAQTAYKYLELAGKWLNAKGGFATPDWTQLPEPAKVELAMAALSKPNFKWDVGFSVATERMKTKDKLGALERKFLRLVTAPSCWDILGDIKNSRFKENGQFPFADWQTLLDRVLALREVLADNPDCARQSARWLAAKGWLLRVHQDQAVDKNRDFRKAAFKAYDEAYKSATASKTALDKNEQTEFLSRRIIAEAYALGLDKITPAQWDSFKRDADGALDPVNGLPDSSSARGARGFVLLQQARQERKLELRRSKFEAAYKDLREAVRLTETSKDEDWAYYAFLQSAVCVQLANLFIEPDQRKRYIEEARRIAETVEEARQLVFPSRGAVYLAYGNALADAELLIKGKKGDYALAAKAFQTGLALETKAPGEDGNRANLLVALARCHYRWAEASGGQSELGKAQEFLERALAENEPRTGAEANYWAGAIALKNKEAEKAKAAFTQSIKLSQEHNQVGWAIISKAALASQAIQKADADYKEGLKATDEVARKASFQACLARLAEAEEPIDAVRGDYLDVLQIDSDRMRRTMATLGGGVHFKREDYRAAASYFDKGLSDLDNIVADQVPLFNLKIAALRAGGLFSKQNDAAMKNLVRQCLALASWVGRHPELDKQTRSQFETTARGIHKELTAALGQGQFQDLEREVEQLGSALKKLPNK
jgi:serine/threonine protein kinase